MGKNILEKWVKRSKDVKYMYWVKKICLGVLDEENVTKTMKQV